MNLAAVLRATAMRHPEVSALIEDRQAISYRELQHRVETAALHLRERGVGRGDVVVVAVQSGALNTILFYAAARVGAAICTLDWRSRPAEREAILRLLTPKLLLLDRPLSGQTMVATDTVDEEWLLPPRNPGPPLDVVDDPELAAMLMLTSGSTGQPKAMIVTQGAALWRGMLRAFETNLQPSRRVLTPISPTATTAIQGMLGQIFAGATTYQFPALFSPDELLEALLRNRIEQTTLVPTVARWMLDRAVDGRVLLPELGMLRVVGAAFHPEEKRAVMARVSPNLFDGYGAAGAGGISRATPRDIVERPTSVGQPLMTASVDIVDDSGQRLPTGSVGRVRVRTLAAARGYYGTSGHEERDEIFHNGYTFPGDLGRLDEDGYLYLEGRAASLIIRGGQNIYPEEIERALLAHPAVADAAVFGAPDPALGEMPVALLVMRTDVPEAELMVHCHARLASHKVPGLLRFVPSLPRTAAGKTARGELAKMISG